MVKHEIGKALRELRESKGWSQEQLARKVNTSKQIVSNVERAASAPDIDKVAAMFTALGGELAVYAVVEGRPAPHLIGPVAELVQAASALSDADLARLVRVARAYAGIEDDEGKDLVVRQLERELLLMQRRALAS